MTGRRTYYSKQPSPNARRNAVASYLTGQGIQGVEKNSPLDSYLWLPRDGTKPWIVKVSGRKFGPDLEKMTLGMMLDTAAEKGGVPLLIRAVHRELDRAQATVYLEDLVPWLVDLSERRT